METDIFEASTPKDPLPCGPGAEKLIAARQHAEYPTLQANDNLYSQQLQGHTGQIADCAVCHTDVSTAANGAPHNMHNIE